MSKLKEAFDRIYAGTGVPFLEPEAYLSILERMGSKVKELAEKFKVDLSDNEEWDLELIKGLFRKGMNFVPIEANLSSVMLLAEDGLKEFSAVDHFNLLELGFGAGWSTVGLWNNLKTVLGKSFTLYSCDKSIYALAATVLMLENFNIPFKFHSKKNETDLNYNGVILILDSFENAIELFEDDFLHAAYSNHGIAYLEVEDYLNVLNQLYPKIKKGGSVISDSLNPDLILTLDPKFIKMRVIFGGNVNKQVNKPEIVGTTIKNGLITKLYGRASGRFLDYMHYLVINNRKAFKLYMDSINSSEEAQKYLRDWVKVPSTDFYVLLKYKKELLPFEIVKLPSFFEDLYIREHPYVETAWFRKKS